MIKRFVVLCFITMIIVLCTIATEANEVVSPKEVVNAIEWIGHWEGEWTLREANMSGKLVLTILEVTDKGKVKALFYTEGPASYHYKNQPAQGEINGNRLIIYVSSFIIYQFTRDGDELRGWGIGGARVEAMLIKK